MLQVQNIEKYYGSKNNVTKALDRVSFNVDAGEFLAIMGASGSGKTTLLNCISTIDTVSAGKILLDGVSIADLSEEDLARFRRERLGFVFQDFNLLDTLTIEENIGLALSLNHTDAQAVQNRVREVAQKLGITDILLKFPYQVSGGQKQRAACARAMVAGQSLLLADEPTGALDSKASKNLLASIVVVCVFGWLVSYSTRFMLTRRSRELGTYILTGMTNRQVARLFFLENLAVGGVALILGIALGGLLYQALRVIVMAMFSMPYHFSLALSFPAIALTTAYFALIYLYALRKSRKRIRKMKIYDLVYFDKLNEGAVIQTGKNRRWTFVLSIILGVVGMFLLMARSLPIGLIGAGCVITVWVVQRL